MIGNDLGRGPHRTSAPQLSPRPLAPAVNARAALGGPRYQARSPRRPRSLGADLRRPLPLGNPPGRPPPRPSHHLRSGSRGGAEKKSRGAEKPSPTRAQSAPSRNRPGTSHQPDGPSVRSAQDPSAPPRVSAPLRETTCLLDPIASAGLYLAMSPSPPGLGLRLQRLGRDPAVSCHASRQRRSAL